MSATATRTALTVSEMASVIGAALRELGDGWVEGEVRSINRHRSGHVYLTLADESSNIDVCIWKGRVARCSPLPAQGDLVQAHYQKVDFYAPYGKTSLIVDYLKPTGEGELLRRRAQTLAKLQAEGLCNRRKQLRAFPRRVGVVAGQGSHAQEDVIRHLRERFPAIDIAFCAASVQGVEAVGTIIDALGRLQAIGDVDVIILARGGGSVADLMPFDDERLCRAIVACTVPVVTSIGHTKDRPNCDHVAAAYAPVPAKAAELAIRYSATELLDALDRERMLLDGVPQRVRGRAAEVAELWRLARPRERLASLSAGVEHAGDLLASRADSAYRRRDSLLAAAATKLDLVGRRLPRPASLNEVRASLDAAAAAFFAGYRDRLDHQSARLDAARRRHPVPEALDVLATHLQNTAARIRSKRHDYARAFDRLAEGRVRELRRKLGAAERDVVSNSERLRPAADRVLSRHAERVAHLGALIDAKDFRRLGWLLASDEHGQAVRTVADLNRGDAVHLRFADGEATATVNDIEPQQQGDGHE